jgi:hypothetical protein
VLKLIKFLFSIVIVYIFTIIKLNLVHQGHVVAPGFNLVQLTHINLHFLKVMVGFPFIPYIECDLLPRVHFKQ